MTHRFDLMGAFWLIQRELAYREQREFIIRNMRLAMYRDRPPPRPEMRRHCDRRFKAAMRMLQVEAGRLLAEKPPPHYVITGSRFIEAETPAPVDPPVEARWLGYVTLPAEPVNRFTLFAELDARRDGGSA